MSVQTDEETVKPGIMDRLLSVATRAIRDLMENWINILLSIPVIVAGCFTDHHYNVSLTLIWSMTGIVIGFFISYSDSREELISVRNLIFGQMIIISQIIKVEKMIMGLEREQADKYKTTMNVLIGETYKLETKIKKTTQQREIMMSFLIIYLVVAIFITILPVFS